MTDSHVLITFCERTITAANVNCIPEDWTHPFFEEETPWAGSFLRRCKTRRFGFLPLIIRMTHHFSTLTIWFLNTWGPKIDLNASYPYEWLYFFMGDKEATEPITSIRYGLRYNEITVVWLLLQAGAQTNRTEFELLSAHMQRMSKRDPKFALYQKVALWYLNHGVADYNLPSACNWLRDKCLDYATRRSHCQGVTVRVGALLRHGRFGRWDRWLVRHLMQYVWATRRSAQWTPLLQ